jgi:hypothetical protein
MFNPSSRAGRTLAKMTLSEDAQLNVFVHEPARGAIAPFVKFNARQSAAKELDARTLAAEFQSCQLNKKDQLRPPFALCSDETVGMMVRFGDCCDRAGVQPADSSDLLRYCIETVVCSERGDRCDHISGRIARGFAKSTLQRHQRQARDQVGGELPRGHLSRPLGRRLVIFQVGRPSAEGLTSSTQLRLRGLSTAVVCPPKPLAPWGEDKTGAAASPLGGSRKQ